MAVLLGGRTAEILIFSDVTTGAVDDLAKASDIARSMVTRYGMSDHLEQITYEEQRQSFLGQAQFTAQERQYSEETAREIDCAVRELTEKARQKALYILYALIGFRGRGFNDLVQPDFCHQLLLEALIFQGY